MTDEQRRQYYIRYELDHFKCHKCGKVAENIAHRIAQTIINYRKFGKNIIDNNMNIVSSCQKCNDSFNIGMKPKTSKRLTDYIVAHYNDRVSSDEIDEIIGGNKK